MGLPRQLVGTANAALRQRHNLGRAQVLRDLGGFLRIECLGVLVRSGLVDPLRFYGTAGEHARRAGLTDVELTEAVLELAATQRLVRRRGDQYIGRGARMKAVWGAPDVAATAAEAVANDSPIYAAMTDHLRGEPKRPYDAGLGDVIADVSRLAEPVIGPWLADTVRRSAPQRALDVGCGSGVNLRWIARAAPAGATLAGIDLDADAVATAQRNLLAWDLPDIDVRQADVRALPDELTAEPWDLILLAQNIYYWPVEERAGVLSRLGELAGTQGTVVALTAVPTRVAISRHLDLLLRVTEGCWRLPTRDELRAHAIDAGFADVRVRDVVPGSGMAALIARR